MATIYDVAKRAGVSVATVSAIINNSAFVSPKLQRRVEEAIADLKYTPNLLARSLARQRTHTIGMIVPDVANPFYPEIVRGAEDRAQKGGYTVLLANSDNQGEKEEINLELFISKKVDGILLIKAPDEMSESLLEKIHSNNTPLVLIDREYAPLESYTVLADDFGGAKEATCHLINRGHCRIGIIIGIPGVSTTRDRLAGYREALRESGIPWDDSLVVEGNYEIEAGYEGGLLLLERNPSGVLVTNFTMTIGFLRAMDERNLRCPGDLSLVSYDDFVWADSFRPRLTSVAQPKYMLGYRSADILLGKMRGRFKRNKIEILRNKLIVRESSR